MIAVAIIISWGAVPKATDAESSSDLAGGQTRHGREVALADWIGRRGSAAVQSTRAESHRVWWVPVPATRCCDLNYGPGSGPGPGSVPDVLGQFQKRAAAETDETIARARARAPLRFQVSTRRRSTDPS